LAEKWEVVYELSNDAIEFGSFRAHCVKVAEDIPKLSATQM